MFEGQKGPTQTDGWFCRLGLSRATRYYRTGSIVTFITTVLLNPGERFIPFHRFVILTGLRYHRERKRMSRSFG
jgi:hypothetical protein